jgi:uncharacterized membrane protein
MEATRDRIRGWWYTLENSLWFLPAVFTIASIALALLTVRIDQAVRFDRNGLRVWVFGGGAEGARGVLSAIAGTMMTVTALVFSITIVALQVAITQLTPRVLRSVMADRGNQAVLGFFIATFTYALIVLRAVRSPLEDQGGFVPALSVTISIALALISVAMLIYFMHHSANSLRTSVVIARIAAATQNLIESLYPENIGHPAAEPLAPPGRSSVVRSDASGYLQAINAGALFAFAEQRRLIVQIDLTIGTFVLPGATVATVWHDGPVDEDDAEEMVGTVRAALVLGSERTMQSDVAFGLQQLSDIALRALSPGINDPTTATVCVNQLAALLVRLANRGEPQAVRVDDAGCARLVLPAPPFSELVAIAFEQICTFGRDDPAFMRRLTTMLERAAALSPPERRPPLRRFAQTLAAAGSETATAIADDACSPSPGLPLESR